MFSFFQRKAKPLNYSFLHTDMHSHLLPGIDDGAKTLEESLTLIRHLQQMGFQKIITTPHIMGEYYPNTPEIIRSKLAQLKTALQTAGIEIPIEAAAEYFLDDFFEELLNTETDLLTFGERHLLIEFSTFSESPKVFDLIFQLHTRGYQPIIAHPERYLYYGDRLEVFSKFKSLGCALQVNLLSLAGYYGEAQKRLGIKLLKSGQVDYLGTDLHRESQVQKLLEINDRRVIKLLQQLDFKNEQL